jgi:hypothetical protein
VSAGLAAAAAAAALRGATANLAEHIAARADRGLVHAIFSQTR